MKPNDNYRPDSIYTKLRTELYNNGLFEDQADAVMAQVIASDASEAMKGR